MPSGSPAKRVTRRYPGSSFGRRNCAPGRDDACQMYAADREIYRVLFCLHELQPDTVGLSVQKMELECVGGMESLARRLHEHSALRPDVTVQQATDELWMICSFDSFGSLNTDRGKSVEETIELHVQTTERSLCRETHGSRH